MISVRALALAALLIPLSAVAQDNRPSVVPVPSLSSEPWRIVPKATESSDPTRSLLAGIGQYKSDAFRVGLSGDILPINSIKGPNAPSAKNSTDDEICLTMRTYVVARDAKDSESTHLVRYSTCQPASQYRLKTAQVQVRSSER